MAQAAEALTISIEEAAQKLGVGRNTAYEAAHRGEIPTIRIGRLLRVPKAGIERMLRGDAPRKTGGDA
jgi:excisionase family DNA binding protein